MSPTMHWRARAIQRVIHALRKLVPISHVVLLDSAHACHHPLSSLTRAQRRQRLIDTYGVPGADGRCSAQCAYCGTTKGTIEVEHIVPLSRGGTDAQDNLTLACPACNRRKGDRTPQEAHMLPRFPDLSAPATPQRAAPYIRLTTTLLVEQLQQHGLIVIGNADLPDTLPPSLGAALTSFAATPGDVMTVVARPINRPRKQVYTSRNYPLATPLRSGLEQVGRTIKRRNRVNTGLLLYRQGQRTRVTVLKAGMPLPPDAQPRQLIRLGMLCRGERLGKTVTGIVQAIHSSGKLSLITPIHVSVAGLSWQRTIISARLPLHILSSDRVLFLEIPPLSRNNHSAQEVADG
jgi:5-methylcytosine-specific restriction endonuclease McrA